MAQVGRFLTRRFRACEGRQALFASHSPGKVGRLGYPAIQSQTCPDAVGSRRSKASQEASRAALQQDDRQEAHHVIPPPATRYTLFTHPRNESYESHRGHLRQAGLYGHVNMSSGSGEIESKADSLAPSRL